MDNEKFHSIFTTLGIPVEPLPLNYTPEDYGRRLLSPSQFRHGVTYSASTDYVNPSQVFQVKSYIFLKLQF